MKPRKIDRLLLKLILLAAVVTLCGTALAAPNECAYPASGTGMGGTGTVAKSTGIGGTGIGGTGIIAGEVILSRGNAMAQSGSHSRPLAKGTPVCVGETIVTAREATVDIRMTDDGLVSVRPETRMKIEQFAYAGTSRDVSVISLLKGAGRFVTGKLGKLYPQNDLIKTPTATIGVRGTDHEATVILPSDRSSFRSGTYDKVNQGVTFIRTERGEIDVHPNQVGLAVSAEAMPVLLKDIPDFYPSSAAVKEEGRAFEAEKREAAGEARGEGRSEAQSRERPGRGAEFPNPAEIRERGGEIPENPAMEIHEAPSAPELPESPSVPEVPELPESQESH